MRPDAKQTALRLTQYCRDRQWAGYEPCDVLNSTLFKRLPFLDSRWPRIAFVQLMRRFPINLRGILGVAPSVNAKGLGLYLATALNFEKAGIKLDWDMAGEMIERIVAARSPGHEYWCWGYNYPWQARNVLVPTAEPNLVCTAFVANALIRAYEERGEQRCLEMARSAADYMLDKLYWTDGGAVVGFAYPSPDSRLQVHNANLLAAALLAKIHKLTGEQRYLDPALRVARYTVEQQREDGSWLYGEVSTANWIDNFHTGFNLEALMALDRTLESNEFAPAIERGFRFYRDHFFLPDGSVRYFHNRTHPIEAHCISQSIMTLLECQYLDPANVAMAEKVYEWAMENMWDQKQGYFYFRRLRMLTIRISYMRWTQGWMLLALSFLALDQNKRKQTTETPAAL